MAAGLSRTKWTKQIPSLELVEPGASRSVSLSYEGKQSAEAIFAKPAADCKLVWQGTSVGNRLYYGENRAILAQLLHIKEIVGQVRLIYIDPPFATNRVFQSRSQTDAYCDLLSGANYLEFMRERLILLRELLASDGSIYVHLDEHMACYIKVLMDEIFGRHNFRNWITRKKCNPKNYTHKSYGNVADYLLFYSKTNNYVFNRPLEEWTSERAQKEYQYVEETTGRRYKKVPIHAPGTRNGETGKPWRGMNPPPGKHWQYPPAVLEAMDRRGEIYWSANGNPRRKVYLDNSAGIPIQDIWLDFKDAHNQNIKVTGYPTEKNPDLLQRILQASSNPGDLILDGFAGCGTTLHCANALNRRWIGIDNSPEALRSILRYFIAGSGPMGDFVNKKMETTIPNLFLFQDFCLYASEDNYLEAKQLAEEWLENKSNQPAATSSW
jgi:adenine-specific DNA-methyltransferase